MGLTELEKTEMEIARYLRQLNENINGEKPI